MKKEYLEPTLTVCHIGNTALMSGSGIETNIEMEFDEDTDGVVGNTRFNPWGSEEEEV